MKNKTSKLSVAESISRSIDCLVAAGATKPLPLDFAEGEKYVTCRFNVNGTMAYFRFEPDVVRVLERLTGSDKEHQAKITAWRSMFDYINIQCDRIQLGQVTPLQAFLTELYNKTDQLTLGKRLELPQGQNMVKGLLSG